MKKYIGYIPAVILTAAYMIFSRGTVMPVIIVGLLLIWASAFLLHKGFFWGGAFGTLSAVGLICTGIKYTAAAELLIGIALAVFYVICGIFLRKKGDPVKTPNSEALKMLVRVVLTIAVIPISMYAAIVSAMFLMWNQINHVLAYIGMIALPSLALPLIWLKRRKRFIIIWLAAAAVYASCLGINYGINKYDESITVNTSPNIDVSEYLPFDEGSKIVRLKSNALQLTENLPRIDGAAALFPVYSAFVNAVYPETTELYDGVFQYNNTVTGYRLLAERATDIFIGAYPSEEQKEYAEECETTFEYTPIGSEAFVFFVHKDNPVEALTSEQIRGIYSGEITNWKEVGGKDEEIAAFQRNNGSGSQSMLERFMGDKPIEEAPSEMVNDLMAGIIEQVSDYKNKSNSIGFSFRFYVEGIIKNPDIKMIAVDGAEPTAENIRNGSYPIVTPIYAVTYAENTNENTNENTDRLLEWILSEEGQYIIEKTGYVGIRR